jgi:phosphatidylserine/phosphatidylglycerophosphate/cardiolipin synthase-like enzyme
MFAWAIWAIELGTTSNLITGIQIATGFMGAFWLFYIRRFLIRRFTTPPEIVSFFSPKGGCVEAIAREIQAARHEILVQAYSFTSDPLTLGLAEAKKRGVDVHVLLDKSNEKESYSDLKLFVQHDLVPLIDSKHAIAHNKIMIIDRRVLITGSYNFTNQAEHENAENLVIIKGYPGLIKAYREHFESHKAHCEQPNLKAVPSGPDHFGHKKVA